MEQTIDTRAFAPLVETCRAHGISRTIAFELAASGKLDTFCIGRRRFVRIASLHSLPDRLAAESSKAAA